MFDRMQYLAALGYPRDGTETTTDDRRRRRHFLGRILEVRRIRLFVRIFAFLLGALAAFGLGLYLLDRPEPKASTIEDLGLSRRPAPAPDSGDGTDRPGRTVAENELPVGVFVTGAVNAPGVYYFVEGKRVVDAVTAAGGPTSDAELSRVNLAAPLEDGMRIYVPKSGEDPSSASPEEPIYQKTQGSGSGGSSGTAQNKVQKVNINKAPVTELEKLPGIGPALAQRIVEDRSRNGPFASLQDLSRVSGIGDVKIAQLAPFVTF
jgi:competence protein ComEA